MLAAWLRHAKQNKRTQDFFTANSTDSTISDEDIDDLFGSSTMGPSRQRPLEAADTSQGQSQTSESSVATSQPDPREDRGRNRKVKVVKGSTQSSQTPQRGYRSQSPDGAKGGSRAQSPPRYDTGSSTFLSRSQNAGTSLGPPHSGSLDQLQATSLGTSSSTVIPAPSKFPDSPNLSKDSGVHAPHQSPRGRSTTPPHAASRTRTRSPIPSTLGSHPPPPSQIRRKSKLKSREQTPEPGPSRIHPEIKPRRLPRDQDAGSNASVWMSASTARTKPRFRREINLLEYATKRRHIMERRRKDKDSDGSNRDDRTK